MILSVVGARPNFVKLAPVARVLGAHDVEHVVVHTGQHHDADMSDAFFADLALAPPHHNLGVGSGTHAQQTGMVMQRLEPILESQRPAWMLVYGDVNSTVAAALTAVKLGIPTAHVEAGLRSRDRTMPEEINRILTDQCADLLFAPSRDAIEHLRAEAIPPGRIAFVGNVMIDSLVWALPAARDAHVAESYGLIPGAFGVVTLHRPSNVDDPARLAELFGELVRIGARLPLLFPLHPRTRKQLEATGIDPRGTSRVRLLEPLGYMKMLSLVADARLVITDSGGVQEETTYLGVPCLTVRATTERPITCTHGTNELVPLRAGALVDAADVVLSHAMPMRPVIERWDGHTAERIVTELLQRTDDAVPLKSTSSRANRVNEDILRVAAAGA